LKYILKMSDSKIDALSGMIQQLLLQQREQAREIAEMRNKQEVPAIIPMLPPAAAVQELPPPVFQAASAASADSDNDSVLTALTNSSAVEVPALPRRMKCNISTIKEALLSDGRNRDAGKLRNCVSNCKTPQGQWRCFLKLDTYIAHMKKTHNANLSAYFIAEDEDDDEEGGG
jgi:hypothetical protein